jgi:hypothetical protein
MTSISGQLDNFTRGERITADKLNQPRAILRQLTRPVGLSTQVMSTPIAGPGAGGAPELFEFQELDREYFYAKHLATNEERIKIAKPHHLRVEPWNGVTEYLAGLDVEVRYSYTDLIKGTRRYATREDRPHAREHQIIWREYPIDVTRDNVPTTYIWAIHVGDGPEGTRLDDVEWEDINQAGRRWTVIPEHFRG